MKRITLRRMGACLTVLVITLGGGAVGSMAAAGESGTIIIQGGCGDKRNPKTSGAEAYWEVQCSGSSARIQGWVRDKDSDGQCAAVRGEFANGHKHNYGHACPKGDSDNFTSAYHPGRIVDGYLFEFDV